MANRTYLLGLNEEFFETEDVSLNVLLEAKYCIPLLWLTLFKVDDMRLYHDIPLLLTNRAAALANIDRAAPGIVAMLGQSSATVIAQFRSVIEQNSFANYLLNPSELKDMEDAAGEFHAQLKRWFDDLAAIERGGVRPAELDVMLQHGPEMAELPQVIKPMHLCGYSFVVQLPWEEAAAA